ncbi:MAG TPA: transglutaminase domain-containing protein [Dissulfurispiraceae bacterium]|nr:transglutaminase domain-containing protein [Dissulfurispiraceae bacterium]
MCLCASNIRVAAQWNWEGDTIIHDPIIRACRTVPKTNKRYDIDIRQFLTPRSNAVIRREIGRIADSLQKNDRALFLSRKQHSFDLRLRVITAYLAERIAYRSRGPKARQLDFWLFPEETLRKRSGDCEDRAFLLASLLLASGISSYSIRVALGKVYDQEKKTGYDHVWLMYKNESGMWMLIEPLLHTRRARKETARLGQRQSKGPEATIEYIPYYVFNDEHLWRLKKNTVSTTFEDYVRDRTFWESFDPEFAAGVHNHIFDEALSGLSSWDLLYVKAISLAMDLNPTVYDPRDHFDNGYVAESWDILKERLKEGTLSGLARAGHAVADFYAHTSYEFFGKRTDGELMPFDPDNPDACFTQAPEYGRGGFDFARFSVNESKCDDTLHTESIPHWNGKKLVSGRFGQPGDQAQGVLEKTFITIPYAMRHESDFKYRTCLPHHNEIAVDDEKKPDSHILYQDEERFREAFRLRRQAAVRHIGMLYQQWLEENK